MPRQGLLDCLDAKVRAGRLTRKQAEFAAQQVREMEERLARHKNRTEAEVEAEQSARAKLEQDAKARKREQAFHLLRLKEIKARIEQHPTSKADGVLAHFDASAKVGWVNWGTRRESILGFLHEAFADGLIELRPRWLGLVQNTKRMRKVVAELFGENTGDADAARLAKEWTRTAELARELANRAGADIRFRNDWFLPAPWMAERVRAIPFEQWKRDVAPRLNRARVLSPDTGRPMSDFELEAALPEVYRALATDGLSVLSPGTGAGGSAARKLEHHRLLQFKSAEDWLFILDKYGDGDVFRLMTGHLEHMADEIALMEIFGPKHRLAVRQLVDELRVEEGLTGVGRSKRGKLLQKSALVNTVYRHATHELDRTDEAMFPIMAKVGQGLRAWLTSAQLGSALFSSVNDMKSLSRTARWSGLPQWRLFTRILAQAGLKGPDLRRWALRRAIVAENWTTRALAAKRFADNVSARGVASWFSDSVLRVSGLSGFTQAGRNAFALEMLATLAEHAGRTFDQLPGELQRTMSFHRITPEDWDMIRTAPRAELEPGADFVDPVGVLQHPKLDRDGQIALAFKLMDMVNQEKDIAVITERPIPRAMLTFGTKRGTFMGELARSTAMYKNFSVTFSMLHGQRALSAGSRWGAARYIADMMISMTLLAAVGMTLRDISKGRDPRDWTDPKFWMAAAFQGGGLGVLGDFAYSMFESGQSRHGHDPVTTVMGPVAGLSSDLVTFAATTTSRAFREDQETNVGQQAVRLARRYTPGANLWYARAVLDHLLWDRLQEMVDPDARSAWRRMEERARTDFGQKFWWAPGDVAPQRAPNLGAVAGGS